jgi:glycogen operon protein
VVSYNDRHNEANLENNADGHSHNLSWNCGVEGPSEDAAVIALRKRQMRNLMATLFLSEGVPMMQAGDEFARTQRGNNNAYCQDNEISWVDWRLRASNADLLQFVQLLARLRRQFAEFRRETFLKGTVLRAGAKDVTWLNAQGAEMTQADWEDANSHSLGVRFAKCAGAPGWVLLLLNAGGENLQFALPLSISGGPWICQFDTALGAAGVKSLGSADHYTLLARSVAMLES